jgi:hypothetical protein
MCQRKKHKILHSDRSPLEEQFCVFKIFKVSAIFKMAVKTRHKKWAIKIQHCPISSKFDMWVHNDVPNLFSTLKKFYRSPFSKWPPAHFLCRVLTAILKMADTLKILKTQNCSSNGDLSLCQILCLYHYPFRASRHWKMSTGRHFQNGRHNTHKFNIVRFQRHFICGLIMMSRLDSRHWLWCPEFCRE